MNKDVEYFQKLIDRLYESIDVAHTQIDTLEEMKYNLFNRFQPWDDEEEYLEIMNDIKQFLGDE